MIFSILASNISEKKPPRKAEINVIPPISKTSFQSVTFSFPKKKVAVIDEAISINCQVVAAWCMPIPARASAST